MYFDFPKTGFLKLCTSTFLCTLRLLKKLYFGNQIWKFMYRYFGKFSKNFFKSSKFRTLNFYRIKIGLQLKSLGTTELKYIQNNDGREQLGFALTAVNLFNIV